MATNKIRLNTAMWDFIDYERRHLRAAGTIRGDITRLSLFVQHVGDIQMASLKPEHVESWFYGPKGLMAKSRSTAPGRRRTLSACSHNGYRARLKVFLDWCYRKGYTRRGDLLEHVQPMREQAKARQRPAPHVLLALLDHADNARDRCYIALALNTALRSKEIKAILVGDVDLESGYLSITITKTGDADEQPITADLDREIRRWLLTYAEDIGRPLTKTDYLFPGRRGGWFTGYAEGHMVHAPYEWVPEAKVSKSHNVIKHALQALSLPTRYEGTHTIRRAVALAYFDAAAAEQGDVAALRETSALLHHSSIATTERYLGMTAEKNRRNKRMRGRPFLTAMVEAENVTPLRKAE